MKGRREVEGEKKKSHPGIGIVLSPLASRGGAPSTCLLWRASIKPAPANLAPGTRPRC